jgi:hypothetical protein
MVREVFAWRKFTVADTFAPPCRFQPRRENLVSLVSSLATRMNTFVHETMVATTTTTTSPHLRRHGSIEAMNLLF